MNIPGVGPSDRQIVEALIKQGYSLPDDVSYKINPQGHLLGDALLSGAELAGTGYGKYLNAATPMATGMQNAITGGIGRLGGATKLGGHIGRFAGSAGVLNALKAVPGLGVAGAALGAGDIVLGDDSALNKGMDTLAMGLGGGAGFLLGGPMGAAVGAGLAKTGSDAIQGIGGLLGIKSEKERRMEEALMALQSRGIA